MNHVKHAPRRPSVWGRFRISRVGIAIAVVAFLVLGGTGAYAYWNSTTEMKLSHEVSAGSLAVTANWSTSLGKTYTNKSFSPAGPIISVGAVTVTNTTNSTSHAATSMPYTLNFALPGVTNPNPLRDVPEVTVWLVPSGGSGNCGIVSNQKFTGTWSTLVASNALTSSLRPNQSDVWCIKVDVKDLPASDERSKFGATSGTVSLTPSVRATLSLTGTSWLQQSAVKIDTAQKTEAIFPQKSFGTGTTRIEAANGMCVDVSQGGAGAGTANVTVIQYTCGSQDNQKWRLNNVGSAEPDSKYVKIVPVLPTGKQMSGTTTGVTVQNPGTGLEQQWQLQERRSGVYQLVIRSTGECLTTPNNTLAAQLTRTTCATSNAAQEFKISLPAPALPNPPFTTFTCTNQNQGASSGFTLAWQPALTGDVRIEVLRDGNSTANSWAEVGVKSAPALNHVAQYSDTYSGWSTATSNPHEYRIVNSAGTVLKSGTFGVRHYPGIIFGWGAYDYLVCGAIL